MDCDNAGGAWRNSSTVMSTPPPFLKLPSNCLILTRLLSYEGLEGNYKVCMIGHDTDGGQTAVTPEIMGKGMRIKERRCLCVQITEGCCKSRRRFRNPCKFDGCQKNCESPSRRCKTSSIKGEIRGEKHESRNVLDGRTWWSVQSSNPDWIIIHGWLC